MDPITRAYEAVVDDVGSAERTVTAIVNTGSVDRFRTVIDPAGIDLEPYKRNPVVLWEHGKDPTRGRKPIGRNLWIKRQGDKIVARTQFGKDEYSTGLFEMYRDGMLRGWSIFAIPNEAASGPPTRSEIKARPELAACETVYRACELGEYSAVAVPGNAETLTLMAERGIWYPAERGNVMLPGPKATADEDDPENEAQHTEPDADDEPQQRRIRRRGDRWDVLSEDCSRVLSTHDSEEAAKCCLAAETPERAAPVLPTAPGRPYETIHAELLGEFRTMRTEILSHVRDFADLLRGRV